MRLSCVVCGSEDRLQKAHIKPKLALGGLAGKGYLNNAWMCYHHHQLFDTHIRTKGSSPSMIGIDSAKEEFVILEFNNINRRGFQRRLLIHPTFVDEHNSNVHWRIKRKLGLI